MDRKLQRIKDRYEHMSAIPALPALKKQEGEQLHKQTLAVIDRVQKQLAKFPGGFFMTADDGAGDEVRSIDQVTRGLEQLKDCIADTPVCGAPDPRGRADNFLVLALARLIDNPTCGKSAYSDGQYKGTFVTLLEDRLPRMGLDHLSIQALAKRYERVRRRRAVS
jgi:hypothetical protein